MVFVPAKKMDRIFAIRWILKLMKIWGLWQWKNRDSSKRDLQKYSIIELTQKIIHIPLTFTFVTLECIEGFKAEDLDQASDVLYLSFCLIAIIIKMLNIWYYSDKAWNFINELTYSREYELISPKEIEIWQQKQKSFRNVTFFFAFFGFFTGVPGFVGIFFLEEYELPFAYWVPFEWRTNRRNYWIAYFYNFFGLYAVCFANICCDMLGNYMILHLSLLYKVIGLRLAGLKNINEESFVKELRKIFQFHKNVRRLTKDCETIVSCQVLSQIGLSALIVCFTAYRILKLNISEDAFQMFSMLQFICVMVLEIYLPCYFTNELTVNSSELLFQIYSSDWLELSVPTRKLIYLYMEFLKEPEQIRAGNYFDVGLPIFSTVISFAYKVFALLMNVEEKDMVR